MIAPLNLQRQQDFLQHERRAAVEIRVIGRGFQIGQGLPPRETGFAVDGVNHAQWPVGPIHADGQVNHVPGVASGRQHAIYHGHVALVDRPVGKRGAAIIEARGLSSAASAANAAIDHMRDWALGTNGKWVTMGIPSDGQYGIPKDTMFGFAVTCEGGEYKLVEGLTIDEFSQACINKTLKELQDEQAGVAHLL